MTAPIRPGFAPAAPSATQPSSQALAAQRAFFQAALDRAGAPAAAAEVAKPADPLATAPSRATVAATAEPVSEPLPRLGRYLDIRV